MKRYVWLAVVFMSCGTAAQLQTPSGKPEVTVPDYRIERLFAHIATWSKLHGLEIGLHTDSTLETFTEGVVLVDGLPVAYQEKVAKDVAIVPTVNTFTVRYQNKSAVIYLMQYRFEKRESGGLYSSEERFVKKAQTSQRDLERLQGDLEDIAAFIQSRER